MLRLEFNYIDAVINTSFYYDDADDDDDADRRLNQLEEASTLAADYQSMRRDLISSLSEIERSLNAVDSSCGDNSFEAMQNKLQVNEG